jgi:hypothetical protein
MGHPTRAGDLSQNFRGPKVEPTEIFFRPFGACFYSFRGDPRLAPWAVFFRRFAAGRVAGSWLAVLTSRLAVSPLAASRKFTW